MSTAFALLLFAAGIAVVVAGAELLLDGILGVAGRLRAAPFVITVLVSGFELENLGAGIAANAAGLGGAAAGTFLGGTTFLALGVAGIGALIAPMRARLPRPVLAWTAAAPVPLLLLSLDGRISRLDGAVLLAWFALAMVGLVRAGRGVLGDPLERPPRRPAVRLIAGLALLTAGGDALGEGLRRVAERVGVSSTLLGNTVVAASVEAEEVARVALPARRGRSELALGNIAGTIVHFAAFNAGVIALVKPLTLDHDTRTLHLPVAVAASVLFAAMTGVGGGVGRRTGAALLSLYAAYVVAAVIAA